LSEELGEEIRRLEERLEIKSQELYIERLRVSQYTNILVTIHMLLPPSDLLTADGIKMTFAPKDSALCLQTWKMLAEAIRAIPEKLREEIKELSFKVL